MQYLDKTFWQMSGLFIFIILGSLVAVYYLKQYDNQELNPAVDKTAETVRISR